MALKAAENGHADLLELCIDEGADVSDLNLEDATQSEEVLKILITNGGLDVNERPGNSRRHYDFTKWLLEHGADPNSGHLMADSISAVTAAAERGRIDFSELLVKHGAKVSGSGALAGAAEKQHTEMVGWLRDQGADVDEIGVRDYGDRRKKKYEGTALHKAAANGEIETARLLVQHGARLDIKDPMERTPLMLALEENQEEVARFLNSIESTG
ncbi:MAG: hypothetical protein Q9201_002194 [Fulgogasparrea decipioides]